LTQSIKSALRPAGSFAAYRQPSPLLTPLFPKGAPLSCDGCDDCDDIFDTAPAVILIVTTVTNRHTVCRFRVMCLPFRVRFMV
jgi:hypothetical protein